jgi:polyphosphate kinase 2
MAKKAKGKKHKDEAAQEAAQTGVPEPVKLGRKAYDEELAKLEVDLVKLQEWIKHAGLKVVVVFEGRDTAGKGGTIKRITNRLSPRVVRVAALPTPTEREKTQYYLQRYIAHLPAAGEMVLFDRSWYNRAGVERVMGFCSDKEYEDFMLICPGFERTLVETGIILVKYWLDISQEAQEKRFQERRVDPRRRWKLSPMDLEARNRWDEYTQARDVMFARTSTEYAPWYVIDANVQRMARLNCIKHLLSVIPYEDVLPEEPRFPERKPGHPAPIPDLPHVAQVPNAYAAT